MLICMWSRGTGGNYWMWSLTISSFAYSDGFNSSPLPFPCSITPRSSRHAEVVVREFAGACEELRRYTAPARSL